MKIVSVASEMMPFAKTGGLADVAGTLTREIRGLGHDVIAFLPRYKSVDLQKGGFKVVIERLLIDVGSEKESARVYHAVDDKGVQIYLIDHPGFFQRDQLYGTAMSDYPDNDRRFIFFQRAVLETLRAVGLVPDIIHCHDWQTGLICAYLKTLYARDPIFKKTRSVFTVHNLAYQGNFPPDSLPLTGLSWDEFKLEKLEFYGKISFMKGGLVYSDAVTTVSERYAREIQTKEFGCGMENVLASRREALFGVINGIDFSEWNPETDPDIASKFSATEIEKKKINKAALQKENGFKIRPDVPVVSIISRLVDQKGLDILIPAMESMTQRDLQFVLLGTGDEKYHKILRELAKKHKDRFGIHIVFDGKMAKRIYAGSDLFMMPSYYEPCGLGQMISLRYGTIPLVRATGGLADTIQEFNPKNGRGNGFAFEEYSTEALIQTLDRALKVYQNPESWLGLMKNAMASDFSWTASARRYLEIYQSVSRGKLKSSEK